MLSYVNNDLTHLTKEVIAMYGGNWFNQESHGTHHRQNCPRQTMPDMHEQPRVSPTREYVQTNVFNTYVPHIHPTHTTTVNKRYIHNQHYFPHTESTVEQCFETNTMCGMPTDGCCPSRRRRW